uniref:Uncharacterized protein n=1 Tax=Trichuris muris TaxID=70415 RepID=A0A5S6R3S7_TRIMR
MVTLLFHEKEKHGVAFEPNLGSSSAQVFSLAAYQVWSYGEAPPPSQTSVGARRIKLDPSGQFPSEFGQASEQLPCRPSPVGNSTYNDCTLSCQPGTVDKVVAPTPGRTRRETALTDQV